MASDPRKARRILALQQQLHQVEQWRLADLKVREGELATAQADLIAALNDDHALQGIFIDSMARRLKALAEEATKTQKAKDLQSVQLLNQGARLICAERLAEAAGLAELRLNEKKDLAETIDRLPDAGSQASRKIVER
jgi:uncharacterized coiled-coil protein SlyX